MWEYGEGALAKALVASKLYKTMAFESKKVYQLEVEVLDQLETSAMEFDKKTLELLDFCYRQNKNTAQHLLSIPLPNWSNLNCLDLAFLCQHQEFIAHSCSQLVLNDRWLGKRQIKDENHFKHLQRVFDSSICESTNTSPQTAVYWKKSTFFSKPVVKFWSWTITYLLFLVMYTCMAITRTSPIPEWKEWYVTIYLAIFGFEKLQEFRTNVPVKYSLWNWWHGFDFIFTLMYFGGMTLRYFEGMLKYVHVIYSCNIAYW